MAYIKRFEDIEAWQKARELNKCIYQVTNEPGFTRDFTLINQIRRSSISVTSNIAEGFERKGVNEFLHFLNIAKVSCAELRSQLYLAFDLQYISEETSKDLLRKAEEISRMLSGFMKYLEASKKAGNTFHEPAEEYLINANNQ